MLQHSRKRKPLIWISGPFPIDVENGDLVWRYGSFAGNPQIGFNSHGLEKAGALNSAYQGALDSLNDARLSVYPVSLTRGTYSGVAYDDNTRNGLNALAIRTGGSLTLGSHETDFASAIADLRQHFDSYYVLSFAIQPANKRSWIDCSIKVRKPSTKIVAPNGFFSSHE